MASVDAAEKETSKVLHSLLSVERIVKTESALKSDANSGISATVVSLSAVNAPSVVVSSNNSGIIFSAINGANQHFPQTIDEQQVIWEGHTIQVEQEAQELNTLYNNATGELETERTETKQSKKFKTKNKKNVKSKKRKLNGAVGNSDRPRLEDNAAQVKERFRRGCECQDESCFRGLSPESVYRHRLNIAELTKVEHDMYLMGVTMACLANPDVTIRHKERRRLRAQYVYQGRRVCLDAFLYLENCTHYQLKRIRKHVMTHGVAPRVHGNHGKKPHNTFPLDIYRHATEFLKQYLETHTGESGIGNSKTPVLLPWDITRKNLHDAYKEYGQILEPGIKLMGYSTFRHFMKEQFPHVRFCKVEPKSWANNQNNASNHHVNNNDVEHHQNNIDKTVQVIEQQTAQVQQRQQEVQKSVITASDVQQVIPLVMSQSGDNAGVQHHQQTTFLVAPVPQLLSNGSNLATMQNGTAHGTNGAFPYQISNTSYVINEQGDIVTTMASQDHPTYTFNRM